MSFYVRHFKILDVKNLGANIKDNSLLILFSGDAPVRSGDQFYEYTPHRNFYYLTNLDRSQKWRMSYVNLMELMEDYYSLRQFQK